MRITSLIAYRSLTVDMGTFASQHRTPLKQRARGGVSLQRLDLSPLFVPNVSDLEQVPAPAWNLIFPSK